MKLRTSCCKPVTLKKDILRFAPIWAIYLVGTFLIVSELGYGDYDRFARNWLPDLVQAFGVVNLCYATLIAACLFGDLYNTKLCYSLHAMPYRRESWLLTHLMSGFLFSFVPNLALCALLMVRLEAYWFLALYWLLAATLQFIFFYGIATVSALLTGNRFAMLLVTAGINFVSLLIYATLEVIYVPMLTGVVCNDAAYIRFSPAVEIFRHKYFTFTSIKTMNEFGNTHYFYQYDGLSTGWGYLAILGVVGIAAMAFGFWLYRKRHLESAGDFIAFPKLKGIACVIMTLCFTLAIGLVGNIFDGFLVWLIVGLVIGFFGSLMLLERRLKVFRKKTFLGFAAMALVMALSLLAVNYDWLGIESWTPQANQVASITIADSRGNYDYYDRLSATVEDPEDIQNIIDAHKDIYSRMNQPFTDKRYPVCLKYKLKSGRTVIRYYQAPAVGEGYATIRSYLYNAKNLLGFTNPAEAAQQVSYMYTSFGEVSPVLYEKLLTALQTEANRGKVAINGGGTYYVEYLLEVEEGESLHRSLAITSDAEAFVELMKGPEMQMGYSDWDQFVKTVQQFGLNDQRLNQDKKEALLMAIRQDIEAGCELGGKWVDNCDYVVSYYVEFPNGRTDYREFYITYKATNTMKWLQDNGYTPHE